LTLTGDYKMNKKFIFEIPIEEKPYSPETCEGDYGSKEAYNSDFPEHVYAFEHINQLFKDATTYCYQAQMRMMADKKTEPDTWPKHEQKFFKSFELRVKYYEELLKKITCARSEIIGEKKYEQTSFNT
jgi:hypothetical protein